MEVLVEEEEDELPDSPLFPPVPDAGGAEEDDFPSDPSP